MKIDTSEQTLSYFGSHSGTYRTMGLASDGLIYCFGNSGTCLVIDPDSESVTPAGTLTGDYQSCAYLEDENAFICVGDNGAFAVFDVATLSADEYDQGSDSYNALVAYDGGGYAIAAANAVQILAPYMTGDQAILTSTHMLYQCAADYSREDPAIAVELTSPTWVEVSATNKYRAFDYTINTKSTGTGDFTFSPGQACTNLGVFGLDNVSDVQVVVREDDASGDIIYDETKSLEISAPTDDTIVNETLYNSKALFDDLEVYATPHITLSLTRVDTGEDYEVGDIAIGNSRTLGVVVYQSSTSRTSYNEVTIDDFGNETVVERASAEYTSFELTVFPQYADYVERILKDSLDQARIWVGDKADDEKMFTFGYYERSPITYSSPSKYETSLKIRGLV